MVKSFLVSLLILLGLDALWLGLIAKNFYQKQLASFERTVNFPSALLSYLLICLGVTVFVLPQTRGKPASQILARGALFGLIVYGVYDLVNQATLANWSSKMTLVDIGWGMVVCALVSGITGLIIK